MVTEMTKKLRRLEQMTLTQQMDPGDEAITDVPNDDDHEVFKHYMEIYDTQQDTTRTRGGRVIKRTTHLDDYGV